MFKTPSFSAGFFAGFFAREVVTATRKYSGPAAHKVSESASKALEKSKETAAHIGESFEDLVAELRSQKFAVLSGGKTASKKASSKTSKSRTKKSSAKSGRTASKKKTRVKKEA